MIREKLFKKYYKNPQHDYELSETMTITDETGRTPDVAFIYSGRNRGKSFEVATQLIADAWYDKKYFGYIRRNDCTIYEIESYFDDKHEFISDMTDGKRYGITKDKGRLHFYHYVYDDEGNAKRVIDEECGFFFALSRESSYKSMQFPNIFNLIFEEVLTTSIYLGGEAEKTMNLYSTVKRHKENFKLYLISNTVSIVNPYSKSWGINLAKNKPGDLHLSKLYLGSKGKDGNEEYILICSHYLKDKDTLTKEDLKIKRNRIRTGITTNKWDELVLYTTIDKSFFEPYKPIATLVFEHDDILMKCDIVAKPVNIMQMYQEGEKPANRKMIMGYIERKTTPPKPGTRVYTNNSDRFGELTTRGYKIVYRIDKIFEEIRKKGWLIGSDNLTMNDFYNILGKLSMMR